MTEDFKTMQVVAVGELVEATSVLHAAIKAAKDMEEATLAASSSEELDAMLEKIGREDPLPYLLASLVGPLKGVRGGFKAMHACAMIEAAMQVDLLAMQLALGVNIAGMSQDEIVKTLVEAALMKKARLQ